MNVFIVATEDDISIMHSIWTTRESAENDAKNYSQVEVIETSFDRVDELRKLLIKTCDQFKIQQITDSPSTFDQKHKHLEPKVGDIEDARLITQIFNITGGILPDYKKYFSGEQIDVHWYAPEDINTGPENVTTLS